MNQQPSLISIILKIWIAALIMNTLFGTALLTDLFTNADLIGLVAIGSGSLAILLEYRPIVQLQKNDEQFAEENFLH